MLVPFGPWRPDLPSLDNYSTEATNVVPAQGSYESQPSLTEYYNALAYRCQGAISVLDSNNNTFWFAGDANSLYMIQNGIWVDVSYVKPLSMDVSIQSILSNFYFGSPIFINDSVGNISQNISIGRSTFVIVSGESTSTGFGQISTGTDIRVSGGTSVSLLFGRAVVVSQRSITVVLPIGTIMVPGILGVSATTHVGTITEISPIGLRQRTSFIIPTKMIVTQSGFSSSSSIGRVSPIVSPASKVISFSLGSASTSPLPPAPASAAGLTTLFFNDDFTSLSFYHTTNNPTGTWKFLDYWQDMEQAGYVDFGGGRTFMVNQGCTGAGSTSMNNASAHSIIQPYFPASQLDATTMRLTCQRAHMDTRASLRALINDIAVNNQSQSPDLVTWLGAFMTTETHHPFPGDDITRPAYVEAKIRFTPANTEGIFSAFWVYSTSEVANSDEIDIFESNDLVPAIWKTNFHNSLEANISHSTAWCDGNFHTFGMLWQATSVKIYRDSVLDGSISANYSTAMRLMITHTCDPYWSAGAGTQVPSGTESVYMDIDYVRVWR